MNLGIGKRSLLGLAAGALMTLGVAAPAFASTGVDLQSLDGNVYVTGSNAATLEFTVSDPSPAATSPVTLDFGTLDPQINPCVMKNDAVHFDIKSNLAYTGTATASRNANTKVPVDQLQWSTSTFTGCTGGTAFGTSAVTGNWIASGQVGTTNFDNSYALSVNYNNESGAIGMTLLYAVAQQ